MHTMYLIARQNESAKYKTNHDWKTVSEQLLSWEKVMRLSQYKFVSYIYNTYRVKKVNGAKEISCFAKWRRVSFLLLLLGKKTTLMLYTGRGKKNFSCYTGIFQCYHLLALCASKKVQRISLKFLTKHLWKH